MFTTGQNVEARCPKARKWIKATVVSVATDVTGNDDHEYTLAKASGIEFTVPASKVRQLNGKAGATPKSKLGGPGTPDALVDGKFVDIKTVPTPSKAEPRVTVANPSLSGQLHDDLQFAFDWFNRDLFEGKLAQPFWVTVRRRNVLAHYAPDRWASTKPAYGQNECTIVDEININPDYMPIRSVEDYLSSIVHEMVHQWQQRFGTPPRRAYHDKEWGEKMESLGLIPSNTGEEGGKKTGQQMTHYIVDGLFRDSCNALLASGFQARWMSAVEEIHGKGAVYVPGIDKIGIVGIGKQPKPKAKKKTRSKFTCGTCGFNAWAKPASKVICGQCHERDQLIIIMDEVD